MIIHHVKLNNNTLKLTKAVLVTGQQKVQYWIVGVLLVVDTSVNDYYFPKAPLYPIFDELSDLVCRAMFVVALGSNVFCGGLNKFGPQKAFKNKQQIDKYVSDAVKQQHIIASVREYETKMDKNINTIYFLCYTQAFL